MAELKYEHSKHEPGALGCMCVNKNKPHSCHIDQQIMCWDGVCIRRMLDQLVTEGKAGIKDGKYYWVGGKP